MRILVTGASGFIGSSFCERFGNRRGYDVVGLDRRSPAERFAGVEYVSVDLTDHAAVDRTVKAIAPEAILHLAAQARVEPSLVAAYPTYMDNVVATTNLIGSAAELGPKLQRFLYASSETVYGPTTRLPSDEGAPLNPDSPYAASKAASELLVSRALRDRSVILRSGMGYGPRSDPTAQVVARFIVRALTDRPILFPPKSPDTVHPTRDVNHVSNFLDGVALAIEREASGVFNVASGQEVSILELAERTIGVVGAGRIEFSERFRYRPGENGLRTCLSIDKARDSLGYTPRVSLEEGLRSTVQWYRTHLDFYTSGERRVVDSRGPTAALRG